MEQTSKAYLSDAGLGRNDGRHSDSTWEALGAGAGTFVGMIYGQQALDEAARILAQTEPEAPMTAIFHVERLTGMGNVHVSNAYVGLVALAESLDAFTRPGGLCDVIVAASRDLGVLAQYVESRQ